MWSPTLTHNLWLKRPYSLSLLGRAIALITTLLLCNVVIWVAAALCLGQADGLLGLALLAWTLGLRHGLDADHISAIDNATRQMVAMGRLPMTCGLFFSLGHSTIVICVNIAIAISVSVYDKLDAVGSVGGIIGTSVSASFLFLVACINTYFLIGAIRHRKQMKDAEARGQELPETDPAHVHGGGCLVRIIGPILRAVDRPWKMYPIGVLFGFGFDTASSIALLAISAIATRGPHGESISHGKIVVLPFLFTAGMSLVDSLDSVLMLYAYAQPDLRNSDGKLSIFDKRDNNYEPHGHFGLTDTQRTSECQTTDSRHVSGGCDALDSEVKPADVDVLTTKDDLANAQVKTLIGDTGDDGLSCTPGVSATATPPQNERTRRIVAVKTNTISSLSISLTLLSIAVALAISLIEIMGLIGENCAKCLAAAEDSNGGGLAGSWWRAWARANDSSGYVGAAIVGCFAAMLVLYHLGRWLWSKRGRRQHEPQGQVV